jgi:hypothetical protein
LDTTTHVSFTIGIAIVAIVVSVKEIERERMFSNNWRFLCSQPLWHIGVVAADVRVFKGRVCLSKHKLGRNLKERARKEFDEVLV